MLAIRNTPSFTENEYERVKSSWPASFSRAVDMAQTKLPESGCCSRHDTDSFRKGEQDDTAGVEMTTENLGWGSNCRPSRTATTIDSV